MQNVSETNLENSVKLVQEPKSNDTDESNSLKSNKPVLQCKYCKKEYKILNTFRKHEEWCPEKKDPLTDEEQQVSARPKEIQQRKLNKCQECGQGFKYAKILQKHELMHKSKSPYWCKLCMENFSNQEEKVLHRLNKHPPKVKKHKCRLCPDIKLNSEEEYLFHITEFHKGQYDDYHMCSDCGKQFKTRSELTHHINSKCGTIKQYKCKICEQDLMTAGSLHNHMLRHTGERCCMCGYCGKMFLTSGQLKVHERTHTQEKAFVCTVCSKGFCHRQSLITHSTLHTGVKPYQCDNCGQSFSCVGNLMKHRRTHSDTCGAIPLTTHRVNNLSTKMKVKINTPNSSKLKTIRKEKELQEKLKKYKQKLNGGSSISENEGNQSNNSSDVNVLLPSQNSDCSSFKYSEEKTVSGGNLTTCTFKTVHDNATYIPNENFLNTTEVSKDALLSVAKDLQECSNKVLKKEEILQPKNEPEINLPTVDIHNTVSFEDINKNQNKAHLWQRDSCDDENFYEDHHTDNNYDSDGGEDVAPLNITIIKRNLKTGAKKSYKKRKPKVSGPEVEEFVEQRGLSGATEGTCQYCNKVYTNIRWLFKHEKEHEKPRDPLELTPKTRYKCSCCKVGFETREECKAHQQNMHSNVLTCYDCDKIFSNVDSLRSHQNIFHKGLPKKIYIYVCEKCGLQFRQKSSLIYHEKSNCGEGPIYECHVCGKGFTSMHTRRSHLRIHDPKKRFLCKFCGKSFRWKGQLKIHERSHTGEKPFKCLYCPKAFAYRESLITHSSLHTGIKPHLCQACGSRFSCIGNLIKHRATHASTCGMWYSKNQ